MRVSDSGVTGQTTPASGQRVTLDSLRAMKSAGIPFAMLTAYDYPTAVAAQAAGIHSLLIGDSMGTVILGHPHTRDVPLELMIRLGQAVRRGAPDVWLVGDMPFHPMEAGPDAVLDAARRFRDECGCDAVKLEVEAQHDGLIDKLRRAGVDVIAHLGLRPQSVLDPAGYRAQARDWPAIQQLVRDAQRMVAAGAVMILLEAVPNEASERVVAAVDVPVVGCGAGPACDGHVVVTHDLLGLTTTRPPRFVPVKARLLEAMKQAMREYAQDIAARRYPGPEHVYPMRRPSSPAPLTP